MTSDEEAEFTAMVMRQSRFVFRVAYAVLLNPHDAEDAVQETFLKLYRHGGWQHAKNERAFLARVAWRTAVDRRRASSSSIVASITPAPDVEAIDPPSPRPDPEQMASPSTAAPFRLSSAPPVSGQAPLLLVQRFP